MIPETGGWQPWIKFPNVLRSHPHYLFPSRSPFTRARKGSFNASEFSTSAEGAGAGSEGAAGAKESPSGAGGAERRGESGASEFFITCPTSPQAEAEWDPQGTRGFAGSSRMGWEHPKLDFLKDTKSDLWHFAP